ncbi:MAG: hypothetical protein NWE89_00065 [Candidatus Bathyarchaeota archaeon]|nr:hypothetical protein [Candidatus Bathyarchaeota archaeon]
MTEPYSIEKRYKNKRAYLKLRGFVRNLQTMEQTPFIVEGIVDTGFDGGLFVPDTFKSDLEIINVKPRKSPMTLADGRKITAETCFAYIQQVDDIKLPDPGLPVSFVVFGNLKGHLIGMEFLENCVTEFNGPAGKILMNISC